VAQVDLKSKSSPKFDLASEISQVFRERKTLVLDLGLVYLIALIQIKLARIEKPRISFLGILTNLFPMLKACQVTFYLWF
jgi:hypothetical protein